MRIFTILPTLFLLAVVIAATPPAAATTSHIRNTAKPAGGRTALHCTEIWRAGGDDDKDFFGVIWQAQANTAGEVFLVDGQLCNVPVYSPTGQRLRTLGGQGEGPGEVNNLVDMFFLPDGALGMIQSFPGRVVTIKADGTPGSSFHVDAGTGGANFGVLRRGFCHGDDIYLAGTRMRIAGPVNTQTHFLSRCDLEGREQLRFFTSEYAIDYSNHIASEGGDDFIWTRWAVDDAGLLYVAPERNRYEIHVIDREGHTLKVIGRAFKSRERSNTEIANARRLVEAIARNHPIPPRSTEVEDTAPDIDRIWTRANGELWVKHSRSTEDLGEGIGLVLDVFDHQGIFARQIALRLPFNNEQDILLPAGPDRIVIMRGAAAGYMTMMSVSTDDDTATEAPLMEIVCFKIN